MFMLEPTELANLVHHALNLGHLVPFINDSILPFYLLDALRTDIDHDALACLDVNLVGEADAT